MHKDNNNVQGAKPTVVVLWSLCCSGNNKTEDLLHCFFVFKDISVQQFT